MGSALYLLISESLRIDETAPTASSALRRKESPSPPDSELFLFNSSALEEDDLTLCAGGGGVQTVMGMTSNGCSIALLEEPFGLFSRARAGLRTQSFRDLSRRRQHLPQYSSVGRRERGRRPQFWNLAPSWTVFLNRVRSFPFHAPGLPRQHLHLSHKLSLGGLGSGSFDGRDFHSGRR